MEKEYNYIPEDPESKIGPSQNNEIREPAIEYKYQAEIDMLKV